MSSGSSCVFCKISGHELPASIVYEDSSTIAFLSIEPVSLGHTVVVPREHSQQLDQASPAAAASLVEVVRKLAPSIVAATKADGYNIGVNSGAAAHQAVMHTHIHIIPRHVGDGLVEWPHVAATPEVQAEVAAAITEQLLGRSRSS